MIGREMPQTSGAEKFRKLLRFGQIAAIVGLTLSVRAFLVSMLAGVFSSAHLAGWHTVAQVAVIVGWCVILWISHLGMRRNVLAPEWLFLLMVLLAWVAIILRRLS